VLIKRDASTTDAKAKGTGRGAATTTCAGLLRCVLTGTVPVADATTVVQAKFAEMGGAKMHIADLETIVEGMSHARIMFAKTATPVLAVLNVLMMSIARTGGAWGASTRATGSGVRQVRFAWTGSVSTSAIPASALMEGAMISRLA